MKSLGHAFETTAVGKGRVTQLLDCLTGLNDMVFSAGNGVFMVYLK